jgi:hypothetical protein
LSLADTRIKGEQFEKIATAAEIINVIGSIPDEIVDKIAGLIFDKFSVDVGLDWYHKAGQKLVECSHLYSKGFRRCLFGYTNTTLDFGLCSVTVLIWRCERLGQNYLQT